MLGNRVTGQPERGTKQGPALPKPRPDHPTAVPCVDVVEAGTPVRPLHIPLRFHRAGCYKESELLGFPSKAMRCSTSIREGIQPRP